MSKRKLSEAHAKAIRTRRRDAVKRLRNWRNSPGDRLEAEGAAKPNRRALWLSQRSPAC
jgi:hypothetical protein